MTLRLGGAASAHQRLRPELRAHGRGGGRPLEKPGRPEAPSGPLDLGEDAAVLSRLRLDAQLRCQSRRFLPFEDCCEWVRRNGWWKSQQEWEEWVLQGEELSPYIPTRPDEYYSRLGKWRGWSFFLLGIRDAEDDPSWAPDGDGPIITR